MNSLDSMVNAGHLATLLGDWRGPTVPRGGRLPAYQALAERVRVLLLDGRLLPRTRLPAERDLAAALRLSRTTVTAAYDLLRAGGLVESRRGSGSWTTAPRTRLRPGPGALVGSFDAGPPDVIDLTIVAPAAPPELPAAVAAAAEDLGPYLGGHGYDPAGLPVLRAAVAERYAARGLPTTPDQIVVTSGALHALDLALRLLVGPGDRVLTETPTYPNAVDAIRSAGGRPVPVPMAPGGWDLEMLAATFRGAAPRLAYLTPEFQNPTGMRLPADARPAVVAAAARAGSHLVVDETNVDLFLGDSGDAACPPPVAVHDRDGRVLSVGSMSKSFWGGLRVGWIRASVPVAQRLARVRAVSDLGGPPFEQLVATRLLAVADTALPRRRAELAAGRDLLCASLAAALPDWEVPAPAGGLALWAELPGPFSTELTGLADGLGLRLAAGPRFGAEPGGALLERFLRLPYTAAPDTLTEAVHRLALAASRRGAGTVPGARRALDVA